METSRNRNFVALVGILRAEPIGGLSGRELKLRETSQCCVVHVLERVAPIGFCSLQPTCIPNMDISEWHNACFGTFRFLCEKQCSRFYDLAK